VGRGEENSPGRIRLSERVAVTCTSQKKTEIRGRNWFFKGKRPGDVIGKKILCSGQIPSLSMAFLLVESFKVSTLKDLWGENLEEREGGIHWGFLRQEAIPSPI